MTTPKHWGFRFTSQVWGFFKRNFRVNWKTVNKKQMTNALKHRAESGAEFKKMKPEDKVMLKRLVKDGKASKLWSGHLWNDLKDNTRGHIYTRKGESHLRYKWTYEEAERLRRNRGSFKTAWSALREYDSPMSRESARRMHLRIRKDPSIPDKIKARNYTVKARMEKHGFPEE